MKFRYSDVILTHRYIWRPGYLAKAISTGIIEHTHLKVIDTRSKNIVKLVTQFTVIICSVDHFRSQQIHF